MKDWLGLLSIVVTLPIMGMFIVLTMLFLLFGVAILGPLMYLHKIGVFNGPDTSTTDPHGTKNS
jgi:hypothetical protein